MKRNFILGLLALLFLGSLHAEKSDSLSLEGTWSFSFSSNNKFCSIRGDRIVNRSGSANFFKVAFLLLEKECSGFPAFAYNVGEQSFSTLKANYQYENISFSLTEFDKIQPKTGTYYPVIALLAYKNGEYGVADYLTFPKPYYFKNSIDSEIGGLVRELERAEEQERYWQMQMFGAPDGGAAARQLASQYTAQKNSIRSQLNAMNYNYYSKTTTYARASIIKPYELIPDKPAATASVPSYAPDYSDYDEGSSSGSSGMHKAREVCKYCNGSGLDSLKTATANYAGANYRPYCDVCREYTYPHYHKNCIICQGRGYTEKWTY